MITRRASVLLACAALSGCVDPLVAVGIELGTRAVVAGIDAATSGPGKPKVAAYCWDPEKQSASTSTSPNCWSRQVEITEEEYEKFRESGVAPAVAVKLPAAEVDPSERYCVNPQGTYFYTLSYGSRCAAGDIDLPEAEWRNRQAQQARKDQEAANAPVYCWDPDLTIEYQMAPGKNCGDDHRITEEQYWIQRARREDAEKARAEAEQQAKKQQAKSEEAQPVSPASPPSALPQQAASSTAPSATPSSRQASVLPPQIRLDDYNIPGSGTGFFVSRAGHLLTNDHVVSNCDTMGTIAAGGIYEATVLDSNDRFDLALLKLPFAVENFATFAASMPQQGDDVFVVGYPLLADFREIKITNGILSGLSGPDRDKSRLQMTAAVQPGNSGGPLVNAAGQVVGVVVSKYTGDIGDGVYAEGINFAVAHEAAVAFLSINGVTVKRSSSTKELKGRDIMRRTGAWTVPLLCLIKRASG